MKRRIASERRRPGARVLALAGGSESERHLGADKDKSDPMGFGGRGGGGGGGRQGGPQEVTLVIKQTDNDCRSPQGVDGARSVRGRAEIHARRQRERQFDAGARRTDDPGQVQGEVEQGQARGRERPQHIHANGDFEITTKDEYSLSSDGRSSRSRRRPPRRRATTPPSRSTPNSKH